MESYFQLDTNPKWRSVTTMNERVLLFVLFLTGLDILGYGMHLMAVAFLVYILGRKKLYASIGLWPLMLFSFSLLFFWDEAFDGVTTIFRCMIYPFAYMIGYGIIYGSRGQEKCDNFAEKRVRICIIVIAVGYFLHYSLNLFYNIGNDAGRNTIDIWTKEARAATGQASFACIPLGMFLASFFEKSSLKKKFFLAFCLLIIFYYNLTLGTRTIFLMALIAFMAALIYSFNKSGYQKNIKTLLILACVVFITVILYERDVLGVRSAIEGSEFYSRFFGKDSAEIDSDSRWDNKIAFIKYMPSYLWGGGMIRRHVGGHAHDIFLDTYDDAGIVALLMVVAILIDAVKNGINALKNAYISLSFKILLICLYVCIFMEFMIEPILRGVPGILMSFCFIHGAISGLVQSLAKLELRNRLTTKGDV